MSSKTIVLVRGTCGAGKTYWIDWQMRENKDTPTMHIDFSDMRDLDWRDRPIHAVRLARDAPFADLVYIEGIFAPEQPGWRKMQQVIEWFVYDEGDPFLKVQYTIIHRPLSDCLQGIRRGPEQDIETRTEWAFNYWQMFQNYLDTSHRIAGNIYPLWPKREAECLTT